MNSRRQRGVRLSSAIFFVALLLVPLFESGHQHTDRDLAKPCAVCVVTHHSPAAIAPVVAGVAPIALATVAVFAAVVSPAFVHRSLPTGRAPPAPVHIVGV